MLAEISEKQAQGRVRDLYDDIKQVQASPLINLVFRHMATVPGCLEWAWAALRPLYADGRIPVAAQAVVAACDLRPPPIPRTALAALHVSSDDQQTVVDILDVYNRLNPMNLVAMTTLVTLLDPAATTPAAARGVEARAPQVPPEPAPPPALPPLVELSDMAPATAALVLDISGSTATEDQIVPSLFRHLARWPAVLALHWTVLRPFRQDGRISHAAAAMGNGAATEAASLDLVAAPPPPLSDGRRTALTETLGAFVRRIPELTAVGLVLRASMPPLQRPPAGDRV